ncbi:hypothetical protein ABW21_db0202098 [Orbilia brochopaga]|nr:hypothetical protein ABW21_db0202098 [Drechslerella brochopaga]
MSEASIPQADPAKSAPNSPAATIQQPAEPSTPKPENEQPQQPEQPAPATPKHEETMDITLPDTKDASELSHEQQMHLDVLHHVSNDLRSMNVEIEHLAKYLLKRINDRAKLILNAEITASLIDGLDVKITESEVREISDAQAAAIATAALSTIAAGPQGSEKAQGPEKPKKREGFIKAATRELLDVAPVRKQLDKRGTILAIGMLQLAAIDKLWHRRGLGEGKYPGPGLAHIEERVRFISEIPPAEFLALSNFALTLRDQVLLSDMTTAKLANRPQSLVAEPAFLAHHLMNPEFKGIRNKWERIFRWTAKASIELRAGEFRKVLRRIKKGRRLDRKHARLGWKIAKPPAKRT